MHIEEQITSKQTVDNSGEIFTGYHHEITQCLPTCIINIDYLLWYQHQLKSHSMDAYYNHIISADVQCSSDNVQHECKE